MSPETQPKLRVFLADDHAVVREGLKALVNAQPDMEVIGQAADGDAAWNALRECRPDVAVIDISMPRQNGTQLAERLREECPELKILALTVHEDRSYLRELLEAGASGYVLKRGADRDLVAAVRAVARGEPFLTNAAQRSLVRRWMEDENAAPEEPLSPRELEVVKLIAEAYTNRQIAETLHLAEKTVESHRANVLRKLGMRDRVELVRYAIRRGLVEP
jgi:DNA-binding NarL/FixJ family response regulator